MAARRDCIFAYRLLTVPSEGQKRVFVATVWRLDKRMAAIKRSLIANARRYQRQERGRQAFYQQKRRWR